VERLERASARTNDVEARKARRILGLAGKAGPEVEGLPGVCGSFLPFGAEEGFAVAAAEQEDEPVQVAAPLAGAA